MEEISQAFLRPERALVCAKFIVLISTVVLCVQTALGQSGKVYHYPRPIQKGPVPLAIPVTTGASVYWFSISTNGFGSAPISMISPSASGAQVDDAGNAYVISDAQGNFSISASNACPSSSSYMYILTTGGDAGTGVNNPFATTVAVIPTTCGISWSVDVTETTTVAAAYALGAFATVSTNSFATDSNSTAALAAAVAYSNSLTNSANATIPAGSAWNATMNTVADMMAECTEATDLSQCETGAIAATPPGGSAPANTFQAVLNIALNPNLDLSVPFGQISSTSPFQPVLTSLPTSWALPGSTTQIIGVTPQSAPAGTTITIGGLGFGMTQGSGVIIINGIQAEIVNWSDTTISAVVPSGASASGIIQECANLLCTNSIPFTIGTTIAPVITGLSQTEGPPLMGFVITGANFGGVQTPSSTVTLGTGLTQTLLNVVPNGWSNSQITVQIPQSIVTGGSVVVTVGALQSNGASFTLDSPFGCTVP